MKKIIKITSSVLLQVLLVSAVSASQASVNDSSIVKNPPVIVNPPVDSGSVIIPHDSGGVKPPVVNPPKDSSVVTPPKDSIIIVKPPKDSTVIIPPDDSIGKPVYDSSWTIKPVVSSSTIRWRKYSGAVSYKIFIDSVYKATTKDSSYTFVNGITSDCNVTVKAVNTTGQIIAVSPVLKLMKNVNEIGSAESPSIMIYPNPATDIITIGGITGIYLVDVIDLSGNLVLSEKVADGTINVGNLITGCYLFRIISNGKVYVRSIVKQ